MHRLKYVLAAAAVALHILDDSRQTPGRCLAAIHYYGQTHDND